MKTIKRIGVFAFCATLLWSCSDDDDNNPDPVNEEEVITTLIAIFANQADPADTVTMSYVDLDADGPGDAVIDVQGSFTAGATYTGAVTVANQTENPPEDITEEVEEEAEEHQFFYIPTSSLDLSFNYEDEDANGDPIGLLVSATANAASNGTLNIVLRHEPSKPNNGTLADAGGETDISVNFPVTIQ